MLNDQIRDFEVRHHVGIQRLSTRLLRQIIKLLDQSDAEIVDLLLKRDPTLQGSFTSQRLVYLLRAIREINRDAHVQVGRELSSELRDIARYEADYQADLLERTIPVELDVVSPPAQLLRAVVTARPFDGHLLRDWVKRLETKKFQDLRGVVQRGMIQGETTDQIVRRVRGTKAANYRDGVLNISRSSAEKLVRTATNHVANAAREEVFRQNSDLVKSVQWVATLDTRTCRRCMAMDGKVFRVGEGVRPPLHINCRCATVPVTKSWRELGIDIDEAPEGTRASMNGQVSATETFATWLKRQPSAVQDEALGKARGRMFRAGRLSIDRFVDTRGNEVSIGQLALQEATTLDAARAAPRATKKPVAKLPARKAPIKTTAAARKRAAETERARKAREREREKVRKAREREKAKKAQERERAKAAREREKARRAAERERLRREREAERERKATERARLKAEREAERERRRLERERAKAEREKAKRAKPSGRRKRETTQERIRRLYREQEERERAEARARLEERARLDKERRQQATHRPLRRDELGQVTPAEARWHLESWAVDDTLARVIRKADSVGEMEPMDGAGAFYRPGSWLIHMDGRGHDVKGQSVWRHEYGHHLDYTHPEAQTQQGARYASPRALPDIAADARVLVRTTGRGNAAVLRLYDQLADRSPAERARAVDRELQRAGIEATYRDLADVMASADPRDTLMLAGALVSRDPRTFLYALHRSSRAETLALADVMSDTINAVTRGHVGGHAEGMSGHTVDYYMQWPAGPEGYSWGHALESFANYISVIGSPLTGFRRISFDVFLPRTAAAFDRIVATF